MGGVGRWVWCKAKAFSRDEGASETFDAIRTPVLAVYSSREMHAAPNPAAYSSRQMHADPTPALHSSRQMPATSAVLVYSIGR